MVVGGAGGGRLVDYSYFCLKDLNLNIKIHIVEVNRTANMLVKEKFSQRSNIIINPCIRIRYIEKNKKLLDKGLGGNFFNEVAIKNYRSMFY